MDNINVEDGSNIWLWILLGLLAANAFVLYFLLSYRPPDVSGNSSDDLRNRAQHLSAFYNEAIDANRSALLNERVSF